MELRRGTRLGVYEIVSLLGRGGMGEVWVGLDSRLDRRVALKVLPDEVRSSASGLERFRREARSLAQLNHPNIVTIHSVEEEGGVVFLTMELVEGRTLDQLIASGPLDRDLFLEVAVALADAIAAAHARGIVHRDLKPSNLMLTADGRLKVLDFGLAKLAHPGASTRDETRLAVTAAGGVVGTAHYMSPEQANGEPVDERSDVFSLGTVLYELASGRRPFDGGSLPAVLYAVVSHDPPPLAALRPELGAELDHILASCLVKKAAERRITAAELRDRLRLLRSRTAASGAAAPVSLSTPAPADSAGTAPPPIESEPSPQTHRASSAAGSGPATTASAHARDPASSREPILAVLPFRTLGGDPELETFADGLSSDVVDGVTSASEATVLPASATERYRGESVEAGRVGAELGARYVLEATVRRAGDRLRVAARVASAETGAQVWSRRYDRDLGEVDLFEAGDQIGAQIVSAVSDVHGVVFEVERQRLEGRPIDELDKWECIFLTLGYDKFLDAEHHLQARTALERAIELDPGFALAWGYLSWVVHDEVLSGFNPRPDSVRRARDAARRAVELEPLSPMLRWLRARVHFFTGDIEGFLSESAKSLELSSQSATILGLIGFYTCLCERWERGLELVRRAIDLNPSYPPYYHWIFALDHFRRGEHEAALAQARRLGGAGNPPMQGLTVAILGHLGRSGEAAAALSDFLRRLPEPTSAAARTMWERWNLHGELLEALLEGLAKAGLDREAGSGSAAESLAPGQGDP